MSTTKNLKWERGTNPPIRLNFSDATGPRSLVGSVIAMVIRDEKWEDSLNDDTARAKRRIAFWETLTESDLPSIPAGEGDLCFVFEIEVVFAYVEGAWTVANPEENDITNGVVTIRFARSEMMLPVGTYYYSIDIMFPGGEVEKIVKGSFKVTDNTVNEI
jgi:hypothetical protein